jgi:hypothetical protein
MPKLLTIKTLPFSSLLAVAACAADPMYGAGAGAGPGGGDPILPVDPGPPTWPRGFHVVGTHIEDGSGQTVALHGVNRSGTEYECVHGTGFFDGPSDEASVAAIATWPKVNAVRVPLNESCWLGINGSPASYAGDRYKATIQNYVNQLHKQHLIPILELHWVGPGTTLATRQQPMPDADHAPAFWADVASTFAADDGVVFEPYNEPFGVDWRCWRDGGCTPTLLGATGTPVPTYPAAGMQAMVDAIRGTGSEHVILLGGLQYSNDLSMWAASVPSDPLGQLGAAWHVYNFNACKDSSCWDMAPAAIAATTPLVATEIGENDCMGGPFLTSLMAWLDAHGDGYLGWSWNAYGACQPGPANGGRGGQPWSLVANYVTGAPNGGYAQALHDHLAGL